MPGRVFFSKCQNYPSLYKTFCALLSSGPSSLLILHLTWRGPFSLRTSTVILSPSSMSLAIPSLLLDNMSFHFKINCIEWNDLCILYITIRFFKNSMWNFSWHPLSHVTRVCWEFRTYEKCLAYVVESLRACGKFLSNPPSWEMTQVTGEILDRSIEFRPKAQL